METKYPEFLKNVEECLDGIVKAVGPNDFDYSEVIAALTACLIQISLKSEIPSGLFEELINKTNDSYKILCMLLERTNDDGL